jgi:hypothetical protein
VNKIVFGIKPSLPNTACYSVLLIVYLVKNITDNLPPPKAALKIENPESLNDTPCFVLDHGNLKEFVDIINSKLRYGNAFTDESETMNEVKLTGTFNPDLNNVNTAFVINNVELFDSQLVVGQYRVFYTVADVTVSQNGTLNEFLRSDKQFSDIHFTMVVRHCGNWKDAIIKDCIAVCTTSVLNNGRGWMIEQLLCYLNVVKTMDFNPVITDVAESPNTTNEVIEVLPCADKQPITRNEGIWQFSTVHFGGAGQECMNDKTEPVEIALVKSMDEISSEDRAFEQKLVDKGLLAPRITVNDIEKLMTEVTYKCHVVEGTNTTIAVAILPIGEKMFTLDFGWSSSASNANFDAELGKVAAIKDAVTKARNKLWELEGYRLAHSLR